MGVSVNQSVHDEIYAAAEAKRIERERLRRTPPLVQLWEPTNTELRLRGVVAGEYAGSFQHKINDSGVGTIELPMDHHLARWCREWWERDKDNVVISVDKDGSRWCGIMEACTTETNADGEETVTVTFLHDYEQLKKIASWPNPLSPAGLQFPKTWQLFGPAAYILKTTLFFNLFREYGNLWSLPEDPLDPQTWFRGLNYKDWPILVKPGLLSLDATPWRYVHSRMKTWDELARPILDECRLMVEVRRWFVGDPQPWPGAGLKRNGQIIVDIVDKSGWWEETATGGTLAHGMARTVLEAADAVADEARMWVNASPDRNEYRKGWLGTKPKAPWVVYTTNGRRNQAVSTSYTYKPATVARVTVGGKSAPGVNEFLSATNKFFFNFWGSFILQPALGSVVDEAVGPLYRDVVLAFMTHRSVARSRDLGWGHYMENFVASTGQAYSLSALLEMRKAFYDTRATVSHEISVADGAPYLIGDRGEGHFFLGDRIGVEIPGARDGRIDVAQCVELTLSWSVDQPHEWQIVVGEWPDRDPVEWAIAQVQELSAGLQEFGML